MNSQNPNEHDEYKLINDAKKNSGSFDKVYETYKKRIYLYILPRVQDSNTAEDITSITFEKAFKSIKNFQWQGISFSSWLYRIAKNTLIDYYRKESNKKETSLIQDTIGDDYSLEESVIQLDADSRIQSVLTTLKPREQNIIRLKFYEGMTNKSIADELNISETNVSTILHRIMKKLHTMILSRSDIDM